MATKGERVAYGRSVRELRNRLGLSRDRLAAVLGLTGHTVKQVELGLQNFGPAARRKIADLEQHGGGAPGIAEGPGPWHVTARPSPDLVRRIVGVMLDDENRERSRILAETLNVPIRRAWEILLAEQLTQAKEGDS